MDSNDRLFYFSRSADKKAGKGVNEFVNDSNMYLILDNIKDWRKILSNFYISPFTWNGKKWKTVEHAFQSAKIALVDETKAYWFTIDSGHEIGQGDGKLARKNRRIVLLDKKNIKHWNNIKTQIMKDILYCKFSQNELCMKVLLETQKAELFHSFGRIMKPVRMFELEYIRKVISEYSNKL